MTWQIYQTINYHLSNLYVFHHVDDEPNCHCDILGDYLCLLLSCSAGLYILPRYVSFQAAHLVLWHGSKYSAVCGDKFRGLRFNNFENKISSARNSFGSTFRN